MTHDGGELIVLADVDNFYASCETVFAPSLRGRPLVVLSNNDGCVVSRSPAAKDLGIANGTPWFRIRDKASSWGLLARSSNYELYASLSARMMGLLSHRMPEQEVYSIDECFLHSPWDDNRTMETARLMRHEVMQGLGLPLSMGVAPTKTLAKIVSHHVKKHPDTGGVMMIGRTESDGAGPRRATDEILDATPVADIWGVGRRLAPRLESQGIQTALDLRNADPTMIARRYGTFVQRTVLELRGIPCVPPDPDAVGGHRSGQILCSQMFSRPLASLDDLGEALTVYSQRASARLRRQNGLCTQVTIFCQGRRRSPDDTATPSVHASMSLPEPSDSPLAISGAARAALRSRFTDHTAFVRAGVMLSGIVDRDDAPALEGFGPDPGGHLLGQALDAVSMRFGPGRVGVGHAGIRRSHTERNEVIGRDGNPDWSMRRGMLSPRSTTHWEEMAVVHAR